MEERCLIPRQENQSRIWRLPEEPAVSTAAVEPQVMFDAETGKADK